MAEPKVRPRGTVSLWDDPRRLGLITWALLAIAGAAVIAYSVEAAMRSQQFLLRKLVIVGELHHVDRDQLEEAFADGVEGNFFGVDLAAVRARIAALPWVRRVEVHRAWPDRIVARVEEHVALARWADGGLVDTFGDRFDGETTDRLPRFSGPAGSEHDIAERFAGFRDRLAAVGAELTTVTLSPRYAWQLRAQTGPGHTLVIELGRDQSNDPVAARLARFVRAYPPTVARLGRVPDVADLRYPNGFALRMPAGAGGRA